MRCSMIKVYSSMSRGLRRSGQHGGEARSLAARQGPGADAEVMSGRGLRAEDSGAELDHVHVQLHDPVLAQDPLRRRRAPARGRAAAPPSRSPGAGRSGHPRPPPPPAARAPRSGRSRATGSPAAAVRPRPRAQSCAGTGLPWRAAAGIEDRRARPRRAGSRRRAATRWRAARAGSAAGQHPARCPSPRGSWLGVSALS